MGGGRGPAGIRDGPGENPPGLVGPGVTFRPWGHVKKASKPRDSAPAHALSPSEAAGALASIAPEVVGFQANPAQAALKAALIAAARRPGGPDPSLLRTHEAVEEAAGRAVPRSWTGNPAFMEWLRDGGEGEAKAELLFQRCLDKALEVVADVTLSDKDLASLLKLSAELTGRISKGPGARTAKRDGLEIPAAGTPEELKKQLHDWAISEGYTPPSPSLADIGD